MSANVELQQQANTVLAMLARAQKVFGADDAPAAPPSFAAPRDLEDHLGRGRF